MSLGQVDLRLQTKTEFEIPPADAEFVAQVQRLLGAEGDRYALTALAAAAVYFKSGSLYKCKSEPDFKCKKYHGNVINMLNSVAIIEAPATNRQLYYMAVVMSNVLRKNSAVMHQTLATRIHRMLEILQGGKI